MADIYIPEAEIKLKAIQYGQKISEGIPIEKGSYTEMALQQGISGYKDGYIACLNDFSNANRNIWELLESKTRLNKSTEIIEELINCLEAEDVDYSVINKARDFLREVK